MSAPVLAPPLGGGWKRSYALDSIEIRRSGGGREVEAYAAVFGDSVEVTDGMGHYHEVIARSAFDKVIRLGPERVSVMFNHALTEYGTPSDLGSVPIARCVSIKADARGLLTVSKYNNSQLADAVLESIRNGEIRGQSFRGPVIGSAPYKTVPANVARSGAVPTITRTELGLKEYGPTRTPYYEGAKILAVRRKRFEDMTRSERSEAVARSKAKLHRALALAGARRAPR